MDKTEHILIGLNASGEKVTLMLSEDLEKSNELTQIALEEAKKIVYKDYPQAELNEILELFSDREDWFKSLLRGIYNTKSQFKTLEEYEKGMKELNNKIYNRNKPKLDLD